MVDWRELNRELFIALRIQQIALFLVLGLIVLVSTFNVASNLVVLVREPMRDVGVLAVRTGRIPEVTGEAGYQAMDVAVQIQRLIIENQEKLLGRRPDVGRPGL